ncbi:MAG: hypothetical protein ACSHYA_14635 [Opitutaceae bacterium]
MSVSILAIFLPLFLFLMLPATIMGWVATTRIRRSDGALYGMGFAASSALFLPYILLLIVPVIAAALVGRFMIIGMVEAPHARLAAFASLLILWVFSFRLGQSLFGHVARGESIWSGFKKRMNRYTFLCVLLVAVVFLLLLA